MPPTLTRNLFYGHDASHFELDVSGQWPTDIDGAVYNIGPDRSAPGGHWFLGQGLLCRIACKPDAAGRVHADFKRVATPLDALRERQPELFRRRGVQEVSPYGYSNFANTNVLMMGDRLFLGYDVGRPVEVDAESLDFITPVGRNAEWLASLHAPIEPLIGVAAHPGQAWDEHALYFANYNILPFDPERGIRVCRWDLEGEVEHWVLENVGAFDSIHDVKVTRDYVVIADLPFVAEPMGPTPGQPRRTVGNVARIFVVRKSDLRSTPPGAAVPYVPLEIPMMAGHIAVDYESPAGEIVLYISHHPITDLTLAIEPGDRSQFTGEVIAPAYEGLIPSGQQPAGIGRYVIDVERGTVGDGRIAVDAEHYWGGALFTQNCHSEAGRARATSLWSTGTGYDPALVSERWWACYAEEHEHLFVAPRDFPKHAVPAALVRFDLEAMTLADRYSYADGAFPHPPTFIPRTGGTSADTDGYILVTVHRDGDKAIDLFDAGDLARGPIASATARGFNPPMLLHSYWGPRRRGARTSSYAVDAKRDAWETLEAYTANASMSIPMARALAGDA